MLTGSLPAADSPKALPIRVTSEMVPAGGTVQIKFFVDSPAALISGSIKATFDPAVFDTVRFCSVFSATGDEFGSAEPEANTVNILFESPSGGLGRSPGLPILTIQVPVKAGIPVGTTSAPQFVASTKLWNGLAGQSFTPHFSASSVSVGGTVSVARLHPGAGLVPAGTVIAVDGTGFKPGTFMQIDGVASAPATFIDSTHLQLTLLASADLQGKHVSIYNSGQSVVDFYPDLQGAVDDAAKTIQPIFSKQQFLNSTAGGFVLGSNSIAVQNTNLVPVDLTFHTDIFNNPSLDIRETVAPGTTLVRNFNVISANISRARLYLNASLPVSAIRLTTYNELTQALPVAPLAVSTPSLPSIPQQDFNALEFLAVKENANPLAQSAGPVYCSPTITALVTDRGGNWLSTALETDSTGTRFVTARVNASGLEAGGYSGGFTISCPDIALTGQIQVSLRVLPAAPQLMSDKQTVLLSVPAVPERTTTTFTVSAEGVPRRVFGHL